MSILKVILALLGLFFGVLVIFWVLGVVYSLIWYLFWIGILGALGYGGYKLFTKVEQKALKSDPHSGLGTGYDVNMSWDEYERKYLRK